MTSRTYTPRSKVAKLLAEMQLQPEKGWTNTEAAEVMGVIEGEVRCYVMPAVERGVLCRARSNGRFVLTLLPIPRPDPEPVRVTYRTWSPDDDLRVPRVVAGWVPPRMVAPRENTARVRAFAQGGGV